MNNKYKSFNFSPDTIQGRFRISFIITLGLMLLLAGALLVGLLSLLSKETQINGSVGKVKYHSAMLNSAVGRSYANVVSYSVYKHSPYREAALKLLQKEITPAFDSLEMISKSLEDDVYTQKAVLEIKELHTRLKDSYNLLATLHEDELESYVRTQVRPLVDKLVPKIQNLAESQQTKEFLMNRARNAEQQTLYFVMASMLAGVLLVSYFIVGRIIKATLANLILLQRYTETLKNGDLPEQPLHSRDEVGPIWENLNELVENLRKVKLFAMEVGDGNFDNNVAVFNNSGVLGSELAEMRMRLKTIAVEEKIRNWLDTGTARMAKIIRENTDNVHGLCDELLANMVDYTESNQGAIFILGEEGKLVLNASYAYGRKKFISKEIEIGHGLVGEAFRDGDTRIITDIPKNYMEITSGLGTGSPDCIAIIPVKSQTEILGILEIATFGRYEAHHISFFETVAGILASSVTTIINNEKNKQLLEEAQEYSLRMNAQEEVLRQHAEELMAMREDLERKYTDLEKETNHLRGVLRYSASALVHTDLPGNIVYVNEAACRLFGYRETDFMYKNFLKLVPTIKEDLESLQSSDQGESFGQHTVVSKGNQAVSVQTAARRFVSEGQMLFSVSLMKAQLEPAME